MRYVFGICDLCELEYNCWWCDDIDWYSLPDCLLDKEICLKCLKRVLILNKKGGW